jgi:hypothetical protein
VMRFFFSFVIRFYASQSVTDGSESTPTKERERERERRRQRLRSSNLQEQHHPLLIWKRKKWEAGQVGVRGGGGRGAGGFSQALCLFHPS